MPSGSCSVLVRATLTTVARSLLEGGALVVLVLLLLLGSVRAGLVVAIAIPLSMLAAAAAMALTKTPGNLMSLGAIDFGLIVDGAVVMMENFVRRRVGIGERLAQAPAHEREGIRLGLFRSAAVEVARPVLFGVLIIIAVYLPIFTLEGLEGKMFRPMAITVLSLIHI